MITTRVWNGEGILECDEAYYTLNNGELKGRLYVRERVRSYLGRWVRMGTITREKLDRVVEATVDNDRWMIQRNGCVVAALCRDAEDYLLSNLGDL